MRDMIYLRVHFLNKLPESEYLPERQVWDVAIASKWLIKKLIRDGVDFYIEPFAGERDANSVFPSWNRYCAVI